jgi:peptidoglycan biosynthesis protein MviN/MurJ (putative lipid II flippase)
MLFMAANEVLTKAFFAENRPKIPMLTSLIAMTANIGLVAVLSRFGIGGIALASGLAAGIQCLLNAVFMGRQAKSALPRSDFADLLKSVLAALVMGGVLYPLLPILPGGRILSTALAVLIGMAVYAAAALLLRSEEARFLLRPLKRK